jgi:hypothetical protein
MVCVGSEPCERRHDNAVVEESVANLDGLEEFGYRHDYEVLKVLTVVENV